MEKFTEINIPDYYSLEEAFPDGRLVMPGDSIPNFKLHDAYIETQRLGRPLTEEEFFLFTIPSIEEIPA